MKRILVFFLFLLTIGDSLGYAEGSGNHGLVFSSDIPPNKKYPASSHESAAPAESTGGSFADREAWRSGIAGTLVMWRKLIENALPSDEPIPTASGRTKKPAAGPK